MALRFLGVAGPRGSGDRAKFNGILRRIREESSQVEFALMRPVSYEFVCDIWGGLSALRRTLRGVSDTLMKPKGH